MKITNKSHMKAIILLFLVTLSGNAFSGNISPIHIKKMVYEIKQEKQVNLKDDYNESAYSRMEVFNEYIQNEKRKKPNFSAVADFRLPLIWYAEEF